MPSSRLASLAARSLALSLLALAGARSAGAATTLSIVNSVLDAVDVTPGNGVCASAAATCTLRAAVQEASLTMTNDVAILLPAGVYRLTLANPPGPWSVGGITWALTELSFPGFSGTPPERFRHRADRASQTWVSG